MNDLSWLIYLANLVNSLYAVFVIFAGLSIITAVMCFVGYVECHTNNEPTWSARIKRTIPFFIVFVLLAAFIPTTKTVMMIAASEFGETLAATEQAQNIGNKAYLSLDKFFNDYLGENND